MSEFVGLRQVWLELTDEAELPPELGAFKLWPVNGSGELFEMPYCSLNSQVWSEFERVMYNLKVTGKVSHWRIVTVH